MEIAIDYKPREWTLNHLHNDESRWKVLVIHRRAGKTTSCLNHLQRDALKTKDFLVSNHEKLEAAKPKEDLLH